METNHTGADRDTSSPEENSDSQAYVAQTSKFIQETSLDKMLEMAEAAVRKKMLARAMEPPKWVLPDDQ